MRLRPRVLLLWIALFTLAFYFGRFYTLTSLRPSLLSIKKDPLPQTLGRPELQLPTTPPDVISVQPLTCLINGHRASGCFLLNNSSPLVSFDLIKDWYEAVGHVELANRTLLWKQTDDRCPQFDDQPYDPSGTYLEFAGVNTEARRHVMLISADSNVPVSSQWDPNGYHYPIQIAQFGLNYFSQLKHMPLATTKPSPASSRPESLDIIDIKADIKPWLTRSAIWKCSSRAPGSPCLFDQTHEDEAIAADTITFDLSPYARMTPPPYLFLNGTTWRANSSLIFRLTLLPSGSWDTPVSAELQYTCSAHFEGSTFFSNKWWAVGYTDDAALKVIYFLPSCASPASGTGGQVLFARNLQEDVVKAIRALQRLHDSSPRRKLLLHLADGFTALTLKSALLTATGGSISDFLLFSGDNPRQGSVRRQEALRRFLETRFLAAADWLVKNQNQADGGWRVGTRRYFTDELVLQPGWCSAMGQGQAISLLVRVFHYTRDHRYLRCAVKALAPFMRPIVAGSDSHPGACSVRTHFLDQPGLPWFEEYPILPSVFVLNGFIYSLIGLFDLAHTSLEDTLPDHEELSKNIGKSEILFNEGLNTLVHVLPLFDSGSGSFYDLRHLNLAHSLNRATRALQPPLSSLAESHAPDYLQDLASLLQSGPNRARWQYHFVHLRQLKTLAKLDPQHADLWEQTFRRWMAYTRGFRSLHN
ncbi:hypothetical protein AAHC03_016601 [Spirometra sp. Aus1]